jgi:hypothetical protein
MPGTRLGMTIRERRDEKQEAAPGARAPACEARRYLPYRMTEGRVLLDEPPANGADDPFAAFSSEADEKAYAGL